MLTKEQLKNNESLKGISDEHLEVIATLSQIDENKIIAEKTRAFWDGIDKDIQAVTGSTKGTTQKSYDFLKETLKGLKEKQADPDKIKQLEDKNKQLEDQLKKGKIDDATKAKIEQLETDLQAKISKIQELDNKVVETAKEWEQKLKDKESNMLQLQWENRFSNLTRGLKFKSNLPKEAIEATIEVAKNKVKGIGTPIFVNENGKEFINFKDENDVIIRDERSSHIPVTAQAKFLEALKPILAEGTKSGGTGSGGAGDTAPTFIDFTGAKNRTEKVQKIIQFAKESEGLIPGTQKYNDRTVELMKEHADVLSE